MEVYGQVCVLFFLLYILIDNLDWIEILVLFFEIDVKIIKLSCILLLNWCKKCDNNNIFCGLKKINLIN